MSRAERLLDLMQLLRRHRQPVTGQAIAAELGISQRTLYRDMATLQSQGAPIDGAPGLGYQLRDGVFLPPMMFGTDELEALVLGMRWVAERGDGPLRAAAQNALAKIAAVLPPPLRHELESNALLVGPGDALARDQADALGHGLHKDIEATLRQAIRQEHKLQISYRDAAGQPSQRLVWPFALGYFDRVRVLVAFCESRQAVRHFRVDRIASFSPQSQRYPQRRQALLKAWREGESERQRVARI